MTSQGTNSALITANFDGSPRYTFISFMYAYFFVGVKLFDFVSRGNTEIHGTIL